MKFDFESIVKLVLLAHTMSTYLVTFLYHDGHALREALAYSNTQLCRIQEELKTCVRLKDKRSAMTKLRTRKRLEGLLDQRRSGIDNVNVMLISIENIDSNKTVLSFVKSCKIDRGTVIKYVGISWVMDRKLYERFKLFAHSTG